MYGSCILRPGQMPRVHRWRSKPVLRYDFPLRDPDRIFIAKRDLAVLRISALVGRSEFRHDVKWAVRRPRTV